MRPSVRRNSLILVPILGLLGLWFVLRTDLAPSPPVEPAAGPTPVVVNDVEAVAASPGKTPIDASSSPNAPQERELAPQPEEPWLPAAVALLERARQDPELTVVRARIERIGKPTRARYPTAEVRLRITQPDARGELRRGSIVNAAVSPAFAEEQFGATTPIAAIAEGDTRDVVLGFRAPELLRGLRRDRWIVVCGPRLPDELPAPTVPESLQRFTNTPDTWVVQGRLRAITGSPVQTLRIAVTTVASGDDRVIASSDVELFDLLTALEPAKPRRLNAGNIGESRWFVFGRIGSRHVLQAWSDVIR